nr:MAG TPA: hypothetical protein [Herelleviridae sp.]
MRSPSRLKQKIWFSKIEEVIEGIDTVQRYSKPIMKRFTVSATAGTPEEISAGIVPTYDRYITRYKNSCCENDIEYEEGMAVWVDKVPQLDDSGNLVMKDDGITPTTPPDYTLKKIIDSQKSKVARYGISKIGGSE